MRSVALLGLVAAVSLVDARGLDYQVAADVVASGNSTSNVTPVRSSTPSLSQSTTTKHTTSSKKPSGTSTTTNKATGKVTSTKGRGSSTITSTATQPTASPFNLRLVCDGDEGCQQEWASNNWIYTDINFEGRSAMAESYSTDTLFYGNELSGPNAKYALDSKTKKLTTLDYGHSEWWSNPRRTHPSGYSTYINPKVEASRFLFANETIAAKYGLEPLSCVHNTTGPYSAFQNSRLDCNVKGVPYQPMICGLGANATPYPDWEVYMSAKPAAAKNCISMQLVYEFIA